MQGWGFVNDCQELFEWLDADGDGQVSYDDLKATMGPIIAPSEGAYFRQDVQEMKNVPCSYPGCWEDLRFLKTKSCYCPLHLKIIQNRVIDSFQTYATLFGPDNWLSFTA